jgi:hypothetical protein
VRQDQLVALQRVCSNYYHHYYYHHHYYYFTVDSIPDPYQYTSPESSTDASTDSDLGEDVDTVI